MVLVAISREKEPIKDLENWNLTKDGKRVCLLTNGVPILDEQGKLKGYRGVDKDITERVQAEEALQESEHRLKTVLDSVQAGIIIIDAETSRIVDANPAALHMIGVARDKVIGSLCHNFICPAEQGRCPVLDLGQSVDDSERILLTAEGEQVPIIKNVVKATLDGRKRLVESFVDIAKLKHAEEALRDSEEKFRGISASAQDAIVMMDNHGRISYWNEAAERIFGYARQEVWGRELRAVLIPEKYHDAYTRGFNRFRETGRGPAIGRTFDTLFLREYAAFLFY